MKEFGIRIGIVGTGRIAKRFVPEAEFVDEVSLSCVYNPHSGSASRFVQTLGVDIAATDSVEKFCEMADAVYIASPHDTHYEYVKYFLEAGKHVLCEKPLCFSEAEALELFKTANERGLVLMEAVKTAYCPGFAELLRVAGSGVIGEIKDIESCFTKLSAKDSRELNSDKYSGSFFDLGSYVLLPAIKLLGRPDSVDFISIMAGKADGFTKANLSYTGKNAYALAKTGLTVKSEGCLIISGTKGYILAKSPWWLTKYFEVRFDDPNVIEKHECEFLGDGLRYEIRAFADRINKRDVRDGLSPQESVWMAGVMERNVINGRL